MQRAAAAVLALGGVLVAASPVAAAPPRPVSAQDVDFMQKAAVSGLLEIRAAQLARSRSASSAVRGLALRLLDDHSESRAELGGLARTLHVALPRGLDRRSEHTLDDLRFAASWAFDDDYLHEEVDDHETAIADAATEVSAGSNPIVVGWARRAFAELSEHLRLVRQTIDGTAQATPVARPSSPPAPAPPSRAAADAGRSGGSGGLPAYGYLLIALGSLGAAGTFARWLYRRA